MSWAKYAGYYFASKVGVNAESHTGTHNGPSIDRSTYDHALASLVVGTMTGSAVDVHIEDSANGTSGWADYEPDVLYGNNKATGTVAAFVQQTTMGISKLDVDLQKAQRYIRFVGVNTGGAILYSVSVLLGLKEGAIPGSTA